MREHRHRLVRPACTFGGQRPCQEQEVSDRTLPGRAECLVLDRGEVLVGRLPLVTTAYDQGEQPMHPERSGIRTWSLGGCLQQDECVIPGCATLRAHSRAE